MLPNRLLQNKCRPLSVTLSPSVAFWMRPAGPISGRLLAMHFGLGRVGQDAAPGLQAFDEHEFNLHDWQAQDLGQHRGSTASNASAGAQ